MRCRSAEKLLSRRLDGRLGDPEARRLDAHLAGCAACAQVAARLERAWTRLEALPAARAPNDFAAVLGSVASGWRPAGWLGWLMPSPRPVLAAAVAASILVGATVGVRLGRAALGSHRAASPEAVALSDGFGLLPFGSPAAGLAGALAAGPEGLE
jgi:anti-sigma factor RsiW